MKGNPLALELSESNGTTAPRPGVVSAICVFYFVVGIIDYIYAMQSDGLRKTAPWCPPVLAIAAVAQLVAMICVWDMKRWAVKVHLIALAAGFTSTAVLGFSPTLEVIDYLVTVIIRRSPFFGADRYMLIPLGVLHAAMIRRLMRI